MNINFAAFLEEQNCLDATLFNEIVHCVHDEIQTSLDEILTMLG